MHTAGFLTPDRITHGAITMQCYYTTDGRLTDVRPTAAMAWPIADLEALVDFLRTVGRPRDMRTPRYDPSIARDAHDTMDAQRLTLVQMQSNVIAQQAQHIDQLNALLEQWQRGMRGAAYETRHAREREANR
jgi:hypothetical protein